MRLFKKLFQKNGRGQEPGSPRKIGPKPENEKVEDKAGTNLAVLVSITIESGIVGTSTGSTHRDFYVYEWFVKDTGEIFYVGKGRGDRYKEYHDRAYEAEKIRKLYDTDVRFIGTDLTEDEALELESKEMTRILNETNDRLTNRLIPLLTKRDNGYGRSPSTPTYKFETAPILYTSEIDEHYFKIKGRPFDKVDYKNLSCVVLIEKRISREELEIIYGGNYANYRKEVIALLEANGNRILKSRYAKSVSAWIYSGDDYVINNSLDEEKAMERIGREIPSYHLIDVWKLLKNGYGNAEIKMPGSIEIYPVNNRIPLPQIRNKNDWEKGFDDGFRYWEQGDAERKKGNIDRAIKLYDKARYNGYLAPVLYNSYAMAYRKLKDFDNEIDILTEGIERYRDKEGGNVQIIVELEERRNRAIACLQKRGK